MCAAVTGGSSVPDSPEPGRSGTISVKLAERSSMLRTQCIQLPVPPCSSTSGGPEPQIRQTSVPASLDVVRRVLARSIAATKSAGEGSDAMMVIVPGSSAGSR